MSDDRHPEVTFDVIQQFTVRPDRRYRVEGCDGSLVFCGTGSQFDIQWLARGARTFLGERVAQAFERSSGTKLIFGGLGVAVVALLLIVLGLAAAEDSSFFMRRSNARGMLMAFFAFSVGLIMITAGVATRRATTAGSRNDFSLSVADIVEATLLPVQSELARRGEPQVARLHLKDRSGRAFRLSLPADADLEAAQRIIPGLGETPGARSRAA